MPTIDISQYKKGQVIKTNVGYVDIFSINLEEGFFIGGILATGQIFKFKNDGSAVVIPPAKD